MTHRTPCGRAAVPICLVAALAILSAAGAAAGPRTLHVYSWSDYTDPELVAEFEREHDAAVQFDYFESDEERDLELAASGGDDYDLIMMNSTRLAAAARRGWLAPIDRHRVPNARHVDPRWANAVPGALTYGVPYLYGTMGIGWRRDLVATPPASWRALLEPSPELAGRILMDQDARHLVAVALKADGESANDASRDAIERAGARLLAQRPAVLGYGYPGLGPESSLVRGEVVAAMMYNGDVLTLQEYEPNIVYTLPEEGGILWVDYLAVAASSAEKPLAHAFLDFLNRPENAARLATYLHFATPSAAAETRLSPEFLADPVIYPPSAELERSEFITPFAPRTKRRINSIGAELQLR